MLKELITKPSCDIH